MTFMTCTCDYVKEGKLNYFTAFTCLRKSVLSSSSHLNGSRAEAWGKGNPKNQEQEEELIQPAFCMYLYIQCDKRGTPKNRFTYKTLCRCHMKKKVQENGG